MTLSCLKSPLVFMALYVSSKHGISYPVTSSSLGNYFFVLIHLSHPGDSLILKLSWVFIRRSIIQNVVEAMGNLAVRSFSCAFSNPLLTQSSPQIDFCHRRFLSRRHYSPWSQLCSHLHWWLQNSTCLLCVSFQIYQLLLMIVPTNFIVYVLQLHRAKAPPLS